LDGSLSAVELLFFQGVIPDENLVVNLIFSVSGVVEDERTVQSPFNNSQRVLEEILIEAVVQVRNPKRHRMHQIKQTVNMEVIGVIMGVDYQLKLVQVRWVAVLKLATAGGFSQRLAHHPDSL